MKLKEIFNIENLFNLLIDLGTLISVFLAGYFLCLGYITASYSWLIAGTIFPLIQIEYSLLLIGKKELKK
jgi:hypothetical protein